jgi:two-component system cell cycle response regulator DivK
MVQKETARLTVLVVDDFADSRFMLKRMLEMNGCQVVEAMDGQEAVEMAQRECPDLILMDLNLPHLDGLAAVEQIRQLKGKCEDVPIIAITAYDTYGMEEAAIEAGCDEYIKKPNDLDYLEKVLRGYLYY